MTDTETSSELTQVDLTIETLGPAEKRSPLPLSIELDDGIANFTPDGLRVVFDPSCIDQPLAANQRSVAISDQNSGGYEMVGPHSFEVAGPREYNYFDGENVTAGILTCGGLCPGLNNVVRGLVMALWYHYRVRRIYGFRYGYRGLDPFTPDPPRVLQPDAVTHIHLMGGTVLGSSRGPQQASDMVDTLQRLGINMLFVAGGDGGMRGALTIHHEIKKRDAKIAIIGVPKTIDNDLPFIERTFGFDTAVSVAVEAITAAHVEAVGAPKGVGLVKLMGRHAGFVAAAATLASREVNLVLVPEQPYSLEGVFDWLEQRLSERNHAVIVVAEGAGQEHLHATQGTDASGNAKLGDIGTFMRDAIKGHFKQQKKDINLKYIDPSYIIRAAPANSTDAIFCGRLAEDAVHAAMAGKTGMVLGLWMNRFTHVPLSAVTAVRKTISLDGQFWRTVVDATGQPAVLS